MFFTIMVKTCYENTKVQLNGCLLKEIKLFRLHELNSGYQTKNTGVLMTIWDLYFLNTLHVIHKLHLSNDLKQV